MNDLFYSEKEKICFWIAGYTDNSCNVSEFIKMLEDNRLIFARAIGKERLDNISTDYIWESIRYKYMRYFYCRMDKCPDGAFVITEANGWTMDKWIRN